MASSGELPWYPWHASGSAAAGTPPHAARAAP
eukprot:CAMPEP_0179146400 /NCGR_PEP_ID=MMETSP0796-20121207/70688_1 /TAXON_ID=73915 /ORGANISM="Pyrodinium bahamense, Strain pbaha01" /LENGTH=31 /DNA_ID= /DNA_START= /DNA_END= /DNA_ORIENTATION=